MVQNGISVAMYLRKEVYDWLRMKSEQTGNTIGNLVNLAVERWMGGDDVEKREFVKKLSEFQEKSKQFGYEIQVFEGKK